MDDWARRIGRLKTLMDQGMCRVGPRLDAASPHDGAFVRGAGRVLALSDAAVALCLAGRANEALPSLRQLASVAAAMRWIAAGDLSSRAAAAAADWDCARWDRLWSDERLLERARATGCEQDAQAVLAVCPEFVRGGYSTLPWAHVFQDTRRESILPARVLELAARWMEHALAALNARWPGDFPQG